LVDGGGAAAGGERFACSDAAAARVRAHVNMSGLAPSAPPSSAPSGSTKSTVTLE
jgi:hypothetical protein